MYEIKKWAVSNINGGFPLITKDIFYNKVPKEEGTVVELMNEKKHYVATALIGKQNKGIGWVISTEQGQAFDYAFILIKIREAIEKRDMLFKSEETNAFRLFNGISDGIGGLTIDWYDGFVLFNWYSEGIFLHSDTIYSAFEKVVSFKGIYAKSRFGEQGKFVEDDNFIKGEKAPEPLIIKESNINFATYLNDGAMTGIFLDQRDVRRYIMEELSAGKRVLNTFSYTGAFSVAAAMGGAVHTTSVDVANRSRAKTAEQFEVNNLDPKDHSIIVEDVFHYFKYANRKELEFDLVVLDPPSFAKTKKVTFSAAKDYGSLLEQAITITAKKGHIIASTNHSGISMADFNRTIKATFAAQNRPYEIVTTFEQPTDFASLSSFPESAYLKVVVIKALA
ncbi:class I SAM-dependent rRNA methyltransferase [Brochothrix campestris]|uniref:Methyltransferase n=1 Tax=Brochothrix campestris FSL F6-1037 TaxID=1265861 RepID=W7CST0_9LIST|nr:class I SAM-dependent rRNA methyltransferase [Brochothrix campestris]EUJ39745.1 methyltransferase [Brochothrix campestris FSL F6-1037]